MSRFFYTLAYFFYEIFSWRIARNKQNAKVNGLDLLPESVENRVCLCVSCANVYGNLLWEKNVFLQES